MLRFYLQITESIIFQRIYGNFAQICHYTLNNFIPVLDNMCIKYEFPYFTPLFV